MRVHLHMGLTSREIASSRETVPKDQKWSVADKPFSLEIWKEKKWKAKKQLVVQTIVWERRMELESIEPEWQTEHMNKIAEELFSIILGKKNVFFCYISSG